MIEAQGPLVLQEPKVPRHQRMQALETIRGTVIIHMYITLNHWEFVCQPRDQGGKDDPDNQAASHGRN